VPDRSLSEIVQDLISVVGRDDEEGLRGEVHGERLERSRQTRLVIAWVATAMALVVLVGGASVAGAYALIKRNSHRIERTERDADRRWCGTLNILAAPDAPPPTTARGRQIAAELGRLRDEFGCGGQR
jgi:hypothetical protein